MGKKQKSGEIRRRVTDIGRYVNYSYKFEINVSLVSKTIQGEVKQVDQYLYLKIFTIYSILLQVSYNFRMRLVKPTLLVKKICITLDTDLINIIKIIKYYYYYIIISNDSKSI